MKFFYRQLFVALLFCSCAFNAKAVNDTLTIGEAFDWQVGDSLQYGTFEFVNFPMPPQGPGEVESHWPFKGFTVMARNNFTDTIEYFIHWTNNVDDTLVFSNLDTPITKFSYSFLYPHFGGCEWLEHATTCDSPQVNCYMNNPAHQQFDTLIVNELNLMAFESGYYTTFVEKTGIFLMGFSTIEYWPNFPMGYSGGCGIELAYYKSSTFEWLNPLYSSTSEIGKLPSFSISPNPATSQLTINTDNQTPVTVSVYSTVGVLMATYQKPGAGALTMPVGNLPPAYYLLRVSGKDGLAATKGFIVTK